MNPVRQAATALAASAALVLIPAAAEAKPPTAYAALGDSYSSGTGAGRYFDDECLRSDLAYPRLLADRLGADLAFAACSGATTADLLAEQLGALDSATDLVTVTVGGNDIGWAEALTACITPLADCTDEIEASEGLIRNELPGLLDDTYSAIADRAPNAEVLVIGYPRLFNEQRTCGALDQPTVEEQIRMNQGADLLAGVLSDAAARHDFTYVDVRGYFAGHAVCDFEPYLHALRLPTVESYHPNALGHANGYLPAVADAV
ncbi:SGNH/GDSL hydrolase family protein [Glycomyces albidus]|uniref:Lipase n=1 Tax=Glycomyces albidus TaxID=2656774 RepID=A0A6L5G5C6_9ACTN|nr:SGNH/GDSL hydrolase family protein [Glycomyces albidus]MQM24838.1 lipase [Glycomyces albidus]